MRIACVCLQCMRPSPITFSRKHHGLAPRRRNDRTSPFVYSDGNYALNLLTGKILARFFATAQQPVLQEEKQPVQRENRPEVSSDTSATKSPLSAKRSWTRLSETQKDRKRITVLNYATVLYIVAAFTALYLGRRYHNSAGGEFGPKYSLGHKGLEWQRDLREAYDAEQDVAQQAAAAENPSRSSASPSTAAKAK